jgi:hypothetical protein
MAAPSGAYNLIRASVSTSTAITVNQVLVPATAAAEFTRAWCNQDSVTTTNQTRVQLNRWLLVGSAAGFAGLKFPGAPAAANYTTGVEWLEYAA